MKVIEVFIKHILLSILLKLNKIEKETAPPIFNENSKLLLIRLNRIGDALVTTPLLKKLKENLRCKIVVLADKKNHFIFSNNPDVDEIIIFQKGLLGFYKTLKLINSNEFDAIVDLHDDVSTTVSFLVALSKIKHKYALKKDNSRLFTKTIAKSDPSTSHVVDRILKIGEFFGLETTSKNSNIQYNPKSISIEKAQSYLTENNLKSPKLIGINISAGSDARFWGIDRYKKLVEFISQFCNNILLLTAPKDIEKAKLISNDKFPVYHSNSFDEFAAVISKLDLLFTPDTSIIHIASAFEIPTFGIYVKYNTEDMIWSPYKSKFDCVVTKEPNFDNLKFEEVEIKLNSFLNDLGYNKK